MRFILNRVLLAFILDCPFALRLMRKLLKKQGFSPKLLITDKLRSYASAFRKFGPTCPHEQSLRRNNRCRGRGMRLTLP